MKAVTLRALIVLSAGCLPLAASAQTVFKCVRQGATGYQSTPCADDADETRMVIGASPVRAEAPPRALPTRQPLRKTGPWRHTTLTLGMSDDEVLNLPGWGRPGRITRVRMPREWREEWVYREGSLAEQRLVFANAKLVDIAITPAAEQVAEAPVRPMQD
jgi:hypothetical protein